MWVGSKIVSKLLRNYVDDVVPSCVGLYGLIEIT
jgi:hypothetical protein